MVLLHDHGLLFYGTDKHDVSLHFKTCSALLTTDCCWCGKAVNERLTGEAGVGVEQSSEMAAVVAESCLMIGV